MHLAQVLVKYEIQVFSVNVLLLGLDPTGGALGLFPRLKEVLL